jgi:hypothetical protein
VKYIHCNSPNNVPGERRMTEIFPLRNYVSFNEGSSEIPNRCIINKKSSKGFQRRSIETLLQKIYQIVQKTSNDGVLQRT